MIKFTYQEIDNKFIQINDKFTYQEINNKFIQINDKLISQEKAAMWQRTPPSQTHSILSPSTG